MRNPFTFYKGIFVEVHGTLDLMENDITRAVFGIETNFPVNPRPGRFMMKEKTLYLCVEVAGDLPVWVPLTKPLNMLKYVQPVAALEWTITHNLNSNYPIVQVFDSAGNVVIPDNINCGTFNSVVVSFNTPTAGVAVIQRGESEGSEQPIYAFEDSFTTSKTWVINHQLGYNPIIHVIVGQDEVQPQSLVHNTINQSTITFSSAQTGSVRCI